MKTTRCDTFDTYARVCSPVSRCRAAPRRASAKPVYFTGSLGLLGSLSRTSRRIVRGHTGWVIFPGTRRFVATIKADGSSEGRGSRRCGSQIESRGTHEPTLGSRSWNRKREKAVKQAGACHCHSCNFLEGRTSRCDIPLAPRSRDSRFPGIAIPNSPHGHAYSRKFYMTARYLATRGNSPPTAESGMQPGSWPVQRRTPLRNTVLRPRIYRRSCAINEDAIVNNFGFTRFTE